MLLVRFHFALPPPYRVLIPHDLNQSSFGNVIFVIVILIVIVIFSGSADMVLKKKDYD
jgi:hypothetical protein